MSLKTLKDLKKHYRTTGSITKESDDLVLTSDVHLRQQAIKWVKSILKVYPKLKNSDITNTRIHKKRGTLLYDVSKKGMKLRKSNSSYNEGIAVIAWIKHFFIIK